MRIDLGGLLQQSGFRVRSSSSSDKRDSDVSKTKKGAELGAGSKTEAESLEVTARAIQRVREAMLHTTSFRELVQNLKGENEVVGIGRQTAIDTCDAVEEAPVTAAPDKGAIVIE